MRDIHIVAVGKIGDKNIEELETSYRKRIVSPKLHLHEVRAHSLSLKKEGEEVLNKIDEISKKENPYIVLMTEKAPQFSSLDFAHWMRRIYEKQSLLFVIGGAGGHGNEVIQQAHFKLSLSEMTYPHKIARLILVEQIYRAQTILSGHPYNK